MDEWDALLSRIIIFISEALFLLKGDSSVLFLEVNDSEPYLTEGKTNHLPLNNLPEMSLVMQLEYMSYPQSFYRGTICQSINITN